eukprot:3635853-Lingulodinium_polyedra.AAC.1
MVSKVPMVSSGIYDIDGFGVKFVDCGRVARDDHDDGRHVSDVDNDDGDADEDDDDDEFASMWRLTI